MLLLLYISSFLLLPSHCHQIQEEKFTIWQGYQFNNTMVLDLPLLGRNMIDCVFKCLRSQPCKAVSYNDLSKTCDFHGTEHSTLVITNVTDENQYLVIPKDIYTTTNFAETVQFETTEDKSLSTAQETALETSTIISQQKNWTILGAKDCYWTTSSEYSGTISYTTGGIQCQYWNTDSPHYRQYLPLDTTAHDTNYCRETNHYEGCPGCYTSDPAVNWDYCYIVKCDACNVDERLPVVPTDTTYLFHVGKFIGMVFTCDTLSPGTSVDHCPVSQCGSDDQWTTGYSVSCTDEDCYTDSTTYQGKVTCTVTGITCDFWTLKGAMPAGPDKNTNYCRDPDNTGAPWCYATDPNVVWEFCPVPKC
ncbi:plasminogen-like isoform X2 [Mytilus edulis]|uniref:plasminogen-like isoform X2 n=1 Tax=Mytilus edulis TaxID=6550 RepID=UPI0039EF0108